QELRLELLLVDKLLLCIENKKKEFIYLIQNLNKKDQERFFSFISQKWKPIENICNFESRKGMNSNCEFIPVNEFLYDNDDMKVTK
ncbi:uncharacterized protein V1478_006061, partial [Vespula squamosa]